MDTQVAGPVPMADVRFYNKISDKDFRKLSWKAPKGSALESQNEYCNPSSAVDMAEYASLKFRPGSGNVSDYNGRVCNFFPINAHSKKCILSKRKQQLT